MSNPIFDSVDEVVETLVPSSLTKSKTLRTLLKFMETISNQKTTIAIAMYFGFFQIFSQIFTFINSVCIFITYMSISSQIAQTRKKYSLYFFVSISSHQNILNVLELFINNLTKNPISLYEELLV